MKGGREGRRDRIYLFHLKGRTASILPQMHPSWVHEFYVFRCKGISIHSPLLAVPLLGILFTPDIQFSFENHWVAGNPIFTQSFRYYPVFQVIPDNSGTAPSQSWVVVDSKIFVIFFALLNPQTSRDVGKTSIFG